MKHYSISVTVGTVG